MSEQNEVESAGPYYEPDDDAEPIAPLMDDPDNLGAAYGTRYQTTQDVLNKRYLDRSRGTSTAPASRAPAPPPAAASRTPAPRPPAASPRAARLAEAAQAVEDLAAHLPGWVAGRKPDAGDEARRVADVVLGFAAASGALALAGIGPEAVRANTSPAVAELLADPENLPGSALAALGHSLPERIREPFRRLVLADSSEAAFRAAVSSTLDPASVEGLVRAAAVYRLAEAAAQATR
jgi:hypothetical protein